MPAAHSVITCTTGEAGSGKSYARCARFLVDRFLKDCDGVHWSNFPLGVVPEDHPFPPEYEGETFTERIARAAAKLHGLDEHALRERVQLIPADVLKSWERGDSGPWEFFEGRDLNGAHIAIDEIHNFLDPQAPPEQRKLWRQWLGEIRHRGCTVEFISQALQKIPLEIRREAGLHIACNNTETERDPFFRILLADWYELRAAFITRNYRSNVIERERRSAMGKESGWTDSRVWPFDVWYYRFYDSYSAPQKGGVKGRAQRRQFERHNRFGVLAWFVFSNAGRLLPRLGLALLIAWLTFGHVVGLGGGIWVMKQGFARLGPGVRERAAYEQKRNAARAQVGSGAGPLVAPAAQPAAVAASAPVVPADATPAEKLGAITLAAVEAARAADAALEAERAALEQARARVVELERALLSGSQLMAVGRGYVVLKDGQEYRIGETIEGGLFEGRKVQAVEWRRRRARLDDGTVLGVGARNGGAGFELSDLFPVPK